MTSVIEGGRIYTIVATAGGVINLATVAGVVCVERFPNSYPLILRITSLANNVPVMVPAGEELAVETTGVAPAPTESILIPRIPNVNGSPSVARSLLRTERH